jgi:hypothetical protein
MTKRATQRETVEAPAPEPVRYTIQEALEKAAERRDARLGRPRKSAEEKAAEEAARAEAVAAELADQTQDPYTSMEFAELQQEAKARDLNAGGSADAIRARLREADAPTAPPE